MKYHSPFFIVEEFISPLMCEDIVDACNFTVPTRDKDDHEIKTTVSCEVAENTIYERLLPLIPKIQEHYNLEYKGTEPIIFEWFPQGSKGEFECGNSSHVRGKWLRTNARDLSCVLFLTDYQENTGFDAEFETYGGKLEFVQHNFSFQPQRGTLVIFPSDPHFISITSSVLAGDLFQAKFHITASKPYFYNSQNFPGNYTNWFKSN
jgi:hypothetical protein